MYYNKERKKMYFTQAKSVAHVFSKTYKDEKALEKDVCDFSCNEIIKMLPVFNAPTSNTVKSIIEILSSYTDWCISKGFAKGTNHYAEIDLNDLEQFVDKDRAMILSEEEMEEVIQKLPNVSDRFIFRALFEGVRGESLGEFFQISEKDINIDKMEIVFPSGMSRQISQELYELALQSSKETVYRSYQDEEFESNMLQMGFIVNSRINSSINTVDRMEIRVIKRITRIRESYNDCRITALKIQRSGLVCEVKRIMKKYGIMKDDFFFGDEHTGLMYEDFIKEINPNFEVGSFKKYQIKNRIYEYLD